MTANRQVTCAEGQVVGSGNRLRIVREQLGFTLRDVETSSSRIAAKHKNDDYIVPLARLFDFETKNVVPSVFRMYSLSVIYRLDFREVLGWYGINIDSLGEDLKVSEPRNTHRMGVLPQVKEVQLPVRMDPSFD